jgi:probable O-glycosylation ligase (exosortase A-associated)
VKQTILMVALTAVGVLGAFAAEPFVGVAIYTLFTVLRPQYIWQWALPSNIGWSEIVAWATIAATAWYLLTSRTDAVENQRRFSGVHTALFAFAAWMFVAFAFAIEPAISWPFLLDYIKIFLMFGLAALVIRQPRQIWWLYVIATGSLIYIGYELNFVYFMEGRVDIYRQGYGGLDNNGAGLMVAMGIPLAIFAWEASTTKWRWLFLAGAPLLLHAMLMSYSRGAMVSLIVAAPLFIIRSRRKRQFSLVFIAILSMVPALAGKEIRARFYSTERYETDASANARMDSWRAAIQIANDYPLTGVGLRNSSLLTFDYGADTQGRVIHSQYLATLADEGYIGLALYLLVIGSTWIAITRTRRVLKRQPDDPMARTAHSMLNGIECALCVFWVGSSFLAIEMFELPYVLILLAAQTSLLLRLRVTEAADTLVVPDAAFPIVQPRAS